MVKVRVDIFRVVEELPENFDRKMTVFGKHLFSPRAEPKSELRYHAVSGRTSELAWARKTSRSLSKSPTIDEEVALVDECRRGHTRRRSSAPNPRPVPRASLPVSGRSRATVLPPAVEKVQSGSATPVAYERVHCGSASVESANDGFPIEELFSEEEAKETFTGELLRASRAFAMERQDYANCFRSFAVGQVLSHCVLWRSMVNHGLIPGGASLRTGRQAVFFTTVNPMDNQHGFGERNFMRLVTSKNRA